MEREKTKMTEIGEIPESWEIVNLKKISEISSGNSAPQDKEVFIDGKFPFCRTSDVGLVHISDNLKKY